MKPLLATILVVLATASTAHAAATGRWIPGTQYPVTEQDAEKLLEQTYDHAYCTGVPRFGHRYEFPDEQFIVFDCDTTLNGTFCTDRRYKAVKADRRGWFRLRLLRRGDCY